MSLVTLTGDFGKLAAWNSRLQAAAAGQFNRRAATGLAAEALTQVQLGFAKGRSPEGAAWKKPVLRAGRPLLDTGRLRNSFTSTASGNLIIIRSNVLYAATHQFGAVIVPRSKDALVFKPRGADRWYRVKRAVIPARPMLPLGDLPPIWESAFSDLLNDLFLEFFNG